MSIMWKSDDGTVNDDHLLNEWSRISIEAAKKIGKTFENAQHTKENIIKAGFVDVVEHKYKMPVGSWSSDPRMKEIGQWNALYFQQGIEGMCLFLLNKVMGVSISLVCRTIPMLMIRSGRMRRCRFIWREYERSSSVVEFILIMRCKQLFFLASCDVVKLHKLIQPFLDISYTAANQRNEYILKR